MLALSILSSACAAPGAEVAGSEEALLGTASYEGCSTAEIRVFEEAHHRGRIAAMSTAFDECLAFAREGLILSDQTVIGPTVECPGDPPVHTLGAISRSPASLAITCDPTEDIWGRSGTILGDGTETFSLASVALETAASARPDVDELAATYWHEVVHDHGFDHCADQDAVWVVDRCLGSTLRAAADLCDREDASYCPNGLMVPEHIYADGSFSTACECVVDNQPARNVRPAIPLPGAAAIQRGVSDAHVFTAAHDGVVTMVSWHDSPTSMWGNWQRADDIAAPLLPDGAVVTAISRVDGVIDLFAADVYGRIVTAWWSSHDATWGGWQPLSIENVVQPGQPVAALARYPHHLDVFAAGTDGAIYEAWWNQYYDGGRWHEAQPITEPWVVEPGNELAVLARDPELVNVFFARPDGSVATIWWGGGSFTAPIEVLPAGTTVPTAHVTAVARHSEAVDVFVAAQWGDVHQARWTSSSVVFVGPFFAAPPGSAVPGSPITAYLRNASHLHVSWVSLAGDLSTSVDDGSGWSSPITAASGPIGADATLASYSRHPEHLDVIAMDRYAAGTRIPRIRHTSWDERTGWRPPPTPLFAGRPRGILPALRAVRGLEASPVSATEIDVTFRDEEGSALRYGIYVGGELVAGDIEPQGYGIARTLRLGSLAMNTEHRIDLCTFDGEERECVETAATTLDGF